MYIFIFIKKIKIDSCIYLYILQVITMDQIIKDFRYGSNNNNIITYKNEIFKFISQTEIFINKNRLYKAIFKNDENILFVTGLLYENMWRYNYTVIKSS